MRAVLLALLLLLIAAILVAGCGEVPAAAPPDLYAVPAPRDLTPAPCCECRVRRPRCANDGFCAPDIPRLCMMPCLDCAVGLGNDLGDYVPIYTAAREEADAGACLAMCPPE